MKFAGLRTRILAMTYEAILVTGLLVIATALFIAIFGDSREQPLRAALQLYLLLIAGIYLVWSWTGERRTLPMRTWRMRLVDRRGHCPNLRRAIIRYLVAVLGIAACGVGLLWALIDSERQFLHDRIAGTRLALDADANAAQASK
jgi:uncharacterized RDD family membrane protein YckC